MVVCAINMQLIIQNGHYHKNNGMRKYLFKFIYPIYLHRLCIVVLYTFSTKVKPMLIKVKSRLTQAKH
jgi:hypothetical protein